MVNGNIDLTLFTDGLRAEREQGITIDVAYKYFSTPFRKFIIADTPGHLEYTRNMVTGASNADLAIVLIDARHGVVEQTKRHSIISSLLGISHLVIAVNKMDLIGYSRDIFEQIVTEFQSVTKAFCFLSVTCIPISALNGDNVVERSEYMAWYEGNTLLDFLNHVQLQNNLNLTDARFPVQYVIRAQAKELADYRGYSGKIISGSYKKGDKVIVLPSGVETTIKSIEINQQEVAEAYAKQSVVLQLTDAVSVSRGDLIVKPDKMPVMNQDLDVVLCWMDDKPLMTGNCYLLQLNSTVVKAAVQQIVYRINIETLQQEHAPEQVKLNDIVRVTLKTAAPFPYDTYSHIRENGGAILIDESSNATVAACMIQ